MSKKISVLFSLLVLLTLVLSSCGVAAPVPTAAPPKHLLRRRQRRLLSPLQLKHPQQLKRLSHTHRMLKLSSPLLFLKTPHGAMEHH